jgi:hypothetical protein
MKKYLVRGWCYVIITIFSFCTFNSVNAQTKVVQVNSGTVADLGVVDINAFPNPVKWPVTDIVPLNLTPLPVAVVGKADGNPKGKCNIWLEYGDGGFTTLPASLRQFGSNSYLPLLMAVPLYDTSKGKDGTITRRMLAPAAGFTKPAATQSSDNVPGILQPGKIVKLTPASSGIVPGEPLTLAVTYKSRQNSETVKYYAILYYNSNNVQVFNPVNENSAASFLYSTEPAASIKNVRLFSGKQMPGTDLDPSSTFPRPFANSLVTQLIPGQDTISERNFFVTLDAVNQMKGLQQGEASVIKVLLVSINGRARNVLDSFSLSNKYLDKAFDPNEISVSPKCILLPKAETELSYKLAFQNLGKGPADSVKIVLHRPPGMNAASFTIKSVTYAGYTSSDAKVNFRHSYDPASNTDTFSFADAQAADGVDVHLKGMAQVVDGLTNPVTMGEIIFTIKTTASAQDSIICYSDIYFHSLSAGIGGKWEDSVRTNNALTVYKTKACECDNTCPSDCYKIFGLCWWWWVLILLAIIILIWLLRRRR